MPVPSAEELQAAIDAESRPLSDLYERGDLAEQDRWDAEHQAIEALRARLTAQQRAELAVYVQSLAHATTERLTALQLPVPVSVTVDLDTPFGDAPEPPSQYSTAVHELIIAAAIADTGTPDGLSGTPLERLEAG